jgi:hypothetical protein
MKKTGAALLLIFLITFSGAQVRHDLNADADSVKVNTSILLECDDKETCPVNSWALEWEIPRDADIINISDSQGSIDTYSREGNTLKADTNKGPKRTSEKIEIRWEEDQEAQKITKGLYKRKVQLLGLKNQLNTGKITGKNILNVYLPGDFRKSIGKNFTSFKGSNGTSAIIHIGEGEKDEIYEFFGGTVRNSSFAYRLAVGTTGKLPEFRQIPVAVYSNSEYDRKVSLWSGGEYQSGMIRIRHKDDRNRAPVLAEETTHAINDYALKFDSTSSSWLDEGISGYVQSLATKALESNGGMPEVFGENVSFSRDKEGKRYLYTRSSSGKKEDLWEYYRENKSFMKLWTPRESENRSFGYAYSELIIRNYISNNNSLRKLYPKLGQKLADDQQKWDYYSRYLDLTPCKHDEKEEFERCLDRINEYDYPVIIADEIPERNQTIQLRKIEVERRKKPGLKYQITKTLDQLIEGLFNLF